MGVKKLFNWIIGRRLATSEEKAHRVGVWEGIPLLGLDALGSAAYGPEAALTVLLGLGAAAATFAPPVILLITALLFVVFLSYRQTIAAYPNGGGSYTVAHENLGPTAGMAAGAALILDYILNAAVGISAGVGALISAFPSLHEHTLSICLGILAVITLINLRGNRESAAAFALPAYLFLASMVLVFSLGIFRYITSGGHPHSQVPLPHMEATVPVGAWLLVRAFANGCTSMTGVEAVSNGVPAFKDPQVANAQQTLTALVISLMVLLLGVAAAVVVYDITATVPGKAGYQSVLSMVVSAIAGRTWLYYATMAGALGVLCLSANTSFAGFPRLCHQLAEDGYLPVLFQSRGRRLVYSIGVIVLASLSGLLLVVFGGVTDHLIPLFAVGALLAFTLSQAGMVRHVHKNSHGKVGRKGLVNLIGAICTGIALCIVLVAKFVDGAWMTIIFVGAILALFHAIKRHYQVLDTATTLDEPIDLSPCGKPLVIVPLTGWSKVSAKALRYARTLSTSVHALHVSIDDDELDQICDQWTRYVDTPIREHGEQPPELKVVRSPYRHLASPLLAFVEELTKESRGQQVIVIIPELVERRWYWVLLHTQRASILKAKLLFHGRSNVAVLNVPWYLNEAGDVECVNGSTGARQVQDR